MPGLAQLDSPSLAAVRPVCTGGMEECRGVAQHRKERMTPIPSLPTDDPLAACGPAARAGMAVDDLKRQIFDATPMGLCLLVQGMPEPLGEWQLAQAAIWRSG
eukprot:gene5309-6776_t